jgi:hypothetical protein
MIYKKYQKVVGDNLFTNKYCKRNPFEKFITSPWSPEKVLCRLVLLEGVAV